MKAIKTIFLVVCCSLQTHSQITSAEYFIDTDPGGGNGTELAMTGIVIDQNYSIPTSGLSDGIHKLYIRVQDTEGDWTTYAKSIFYINPSHSNGANIVGAEYFVDADPGVDNGTPISISGSSVDESLDLDISGLEEGIHKLYIRVKNSDGLWSTYAMKVFNIMDQGFSNSSLISSAEYFIDIDPGIGNGTPIDFDNSSQIDELYEIELPNDLSAGVHFIYLRVQNEAGLWSSYALGEYSSALSINDPAVLGLKIFPNPTADFIYIQNERMDRPLYNYKIIDQKGKLIQSSKLTSDSIDFSSFSTGIYLLLLESEKGKASFKIIRQ